MVFDRPIFGVEDWLGQGTSACNQLHPSTLRSVLWLLHWWPLKFVSRFRALRASIRSSARQKRFGQSPTKFMHSSRIGISDVASISRAFPAISFLNKDSRPPVIVPKHCRIYKLPCARQATEISNKKTFMADFCQLDLMRGTQAHSARWCHDVMQ